ncbi:EAL and HDOD domain-containing protein [Herminiimonas sp. CN]|uniref:EAL and HDOD domain-containing protein n=1 Tax=Herminiimonas sp. CN TaxID=1349818 RepID=UPI0004739A20|nr:HDOD domain-containing protein [Herminiimonas sp. CN]
MFDENFIIREPLLDSGQKVIGYALSWLCPSVERDSFSEDALSSCISAIADAFNSRGKGWLLEDSLIFLNADLSLLSIDTALRLQPKNTVFEVTVADLRDPGTFAKIIAFRERGFGVSLRNADLVLHDKSLLTYLTHVEIDFSSADFTSKAKFYGSLKQLGIHMLARQVNDWPTFDACASLGLDAFVGKLHLTPRPTSHTKDLNPSQTIILKLMHMVKENVEIQHLEDVLKRDPTITYKLLRYINSAGLGQRGEIRSLKQTLQLLGYNPLYRWLSLLLATSTTTGFSPVLLEAAIVRGRLAEMLGQKVMPKSDAETLFVVGMFSLLDRLLCIPMEEVLAKIQVSRAVSDAILSRTGIYGSFLALAEACELNATLVAALASPHHFTAEDINNSHLSALAWVKNLPK